MSLLRHLPLSAALVLALSACQPADQTAPTAAPSSPESVADATPDTTAPIAATFRCGDMLVDTLFDNTVGNVTLSINARTLVLPQAMSASGARYASEDGSTEFWNKGDEASFTLDGTTHDCRVSDETSPWSEARNRGVAFRGLGTEPFWSLEVDAGDNPQMRLDLDMGERKLVVERATGISSTPGFGGVANDGSDVVLRIAEGDCSDGMSDQVYPASIELKVGIQTLTGCGAWLQR